MAKQPSNSRRGRDTDSALEALKPLIVLALFGMILYGAYAVVQKGPAPSGDFADGGGTAPSFQPPDVEMAGTAPPGAAPPAAVVPATPASPAPAAQLADQFPPATPAPVPGATSTPPGPSPATSPATSPDLIPAAASPATPSGPLGGQVIPGIAAATASPPPPAASPADAPPHDSATYLTAESSPPPTAEPPAVAPPVPPDAAAPPDRYASLPVDQQVPGLMSPPPASIAPVAAAAASSASSVFAAAWTDAQEKLAAGRWAEALGALSVWYDDPSLGLEESQRLEDLLGQLAGTVIYSQQDLLLPPHVVAAGETLPAIAAPLGVSWQLLAKINGIDDPQALVPGEQLKLVRGPFDAVVSLSRRRLSLQLAGNFAGSFPVTIGRQFLDRVGGSLAVVSVQRGGPDTAEVSGNPAPRAAVILGDGMAIEAAEPAAFAGDAAPQSSLVLAPQDLAELLDILGPGSRVLVRQ